MPLLSIVFQGMHDGISPLALLIQENKAVFTEDGSLQMPQQGGKLSGQTRQEAAVVEKASQGNGTVGKELNDTKVPEQQADGQAGEDGSRGGNTLAETESAQHRTYGFTTVGEDYFDDALFIGDSRTVGLWEYAGMEERADFFCKTSLTIWNILEKPIVKVEGEKELITIDQALQTRSYGKIYMMVGINELGRGDLNSFMVQYEKVAARIRELQPDAILFVEGIMRVSGEKNETDPIFNNTNINLRNDAIKQLADNSSIFYIDVNEAVCDENGNLTEEYTFDQIHLKAIYYKLWKEFLLEHGVIRQEGQ